MSQANHYILAAIDLSGSMAGRSIATAQTQIQELYSEIRQVQGFTTEDIYYGIIGFDEDAFWLMDLSKIADITNLPKFQIRPDGEGLYKRTSYASLLSFLDRQLSVQRIPAEFESLHILLFSDGFSADREDLLLAAFGKLKGNRYYTSPKCERYSINDEMDSSKTQLEYRAWFSSDFVSNAKNMVDSAGFSGLISRILASFTSGQVIPTVF